MARAFVREKPHCDTRSRLHLYSHIQDIKAYNITFTQDSFLGRLSNKMTIRLETSDIERI